MSEQAGLELTTVIKRNESILSTDLDEEIVMMDVNSGQYFNLKMVSASVWKQLEKPKALSAILDDLMEEFEVDPETCEQEVRAFVTRMVDLDMVTLS